MPAFSGRYYNAVDLKGRVMIPAAFRELISANYSQKLYITNAAFEQSLHLYPFEEWMALMDKIRTLPKTNDAVSHFMKRVVASAQETELDKQGRILIPAGHREDSKINGEAVVVGMIDRIEIWDRALWDMAIDISKDEIGVFKKTLSEFGL